jgi:hypothetical protein
MNETELFNTYEIYVNVLKHYNNINFDELQEKNKNLNIYYNYNNIENLDDEIEILEYIEPIELFVLIASNPIKYLTLLNERSNNLINIIDNIDNPQIQNLIVTINDKEFKYEYDINKSDIYKIINQLTFIKKSIIDYIDIVYNLYNSYTIKDNKLFQNVKDHIENSIGKKFSDNIYIEIQTSIYSESPFPSINDWENLIEFYSKTNIESDSNSDSKNQTQTLLSESKSEFKELITKYIKTPFQLMMLILYNPKDFIHSYIDCHQYNSINFFIVCNDNKTYKINFNSAFFYKKFCSESKSYKTDPNISYSVWIDNIYSDDNYVNDFVKNCIKHINTAINYHKTGIIASFDNIKDTKKHDIINDNNESSSWENKRDIYMTDIPKAFNTCNDKETNIRDKVKKDEFKTTGSDSSSNDKILINLVKHNVKMLHQHMSLLTESMFTMSTILNQLLDKDIKEEETNKDIGDSLSSIFN